MNGNGSASELSGDGGTKSCVKVTVEETVSFPHFFAQLALTYLYYLLHGAESFLRS